MRFLLIALCISVLSSVQNQEFDAHEWGVFNYYQGIGVDIVSGIVEEGLPDFVVRNEDLKPEVCGKGCKCTGQCPQDCEHAWHKGRRIHCESLCHTGKCNHEPLKIVKPVINFYSQKNIKVSVDVTIKEGKVTVWYPKQSETREKDSIIAWNDLSLTNKKPDVELKDTNTSWWKIARETDSSYVTTKLGEVEKFIFYEGESALLKAGIVIEKDKEKVNLVNKTKYEFSSLFVVYNKKIAFFEKFKSGQVDFEKNLLDQKEARSEFEKMLSKEGLTKKEVSGVSDIWEKEFFEKSGLRVIYMMPREEADDILRVKFDPKPKNFRRAMIVCVNSTEVLVEDQIKKLGSDDPKVRDAATLILIRLGKSILPLLQKTLDGAKDPEVRSRLQHIIEQIEKSKRGALPGDKHFIKDGKCNGSCDRVHYSHPQTDKHAFGANCTRCEMKMDVCYLLCHECCRDLSVCYGCNRKIEGEFRDARKCNCGKETKKSDEIKYDILFNKELALNRSKEDQRYIVRTESEWEKLVKEYSLETKQPDFSKDLVALMLIARNGKHDVRCVVEEENRVRIVMTISYEKQNPDLFNMVAIKLKKTDKPVEFCIKEK